MKPATPTIRVNEVPETGPPTGRLLGLEAELESSEGRVVVMSLEYQGMATTEPSTIHLAMTPPAAAQLSRRLRKAVKAYLRSGDGGEDTR